VDVWHSPKKETLNRMPVLARGQRYLARFHGWSYNDFPYGSGSRASERLWVGERGMTKEKVHKFGKQTKLVLEGRDD